jgi:HEAT repeat protein
MTAHGEALRDPDHQLRIRAIDTLAAIPHVEAVRALIPLLGDSTAADDGFVRDRIAAALRTRGEAKLVDMISYVFAGRMTALKRYEGEHLPQVIEALVEALEGYFTGTNAARALAEVHAVEALPRLRKVLRRVGTRDPIGQAVADAIE